MLVDSFVETFLRVAWCLQSFWKASLKEGFSDSGGAWLKRKGVFKGRVSSNLIVLGGGN